MDEEIVICMETQEAMRALCAVNDGDCALLYAYTAASGGHCRLADAALHTGFDDRRMERAKSLLILYKICRQAGAGAGQDEGGYTPAELLSAQRTDPSFSGICDYFEQAVGRSLRKSEIETLYGIDNLVGGHLHCADIVATCEVGAQDVAQPRIVLFVAIALPQFFVVQFFECRYCDDVRRQRRCRSEYVCQLAPVLVQPYR